MTKHHLRAALTALLICATRPALASSPVMFWDPETALTVPPETVGLWGAPKQQKLAVSDNGEVHLLYARRAESSLVYYKRLVHGAGWLPDTCISFNPSQMYQYQTGPAVAIGPAGDLHTAWIDYSSECVWYKMRNTAGAWDSAPAPLTASPHINHDYPVIVCTPDGHVHVAWKEYSSTLGKWLVYREKVGETWSPAFVVDSVDTASRANLSDASLAAGADNRVHLVFTGRWLGGPSATQVYYRCRTGATWGERERVSLGSDDASQVNAVVTSSPLTAEPHVVWAGDRPDTTSDCIWYSNRTGSGWLPPQLISDSLRRTNQASPSLVFTRGGIGHAVWLDHRETGSTRNIMYSERSPSGAWQPPVALTCDSVPRGQAVLAAGGSGPDSNHIHLVWTDWRHGPNLEQVYYRHGAPSPHGIKWSEEIPLGSTRKQAAVATICRGVLVLRVDGSQKTAYRVELLDISGRCALARTLERSTTRPLSLNVSHVPPGIYFVRVEEPGGRGNRGPSVAKVVLTR